MNSLAALARLVENLIRFGTIAEVDHGDPAQQKPPRVRVQTGTLLTGWLPWLNPRAGADQEWNPPTINEQVVLLSPSGQLANGVVITGLFSDHTPANGDRAGLHRRTYRDGAVIEYDSVTHKLTATIPGDATLTAQGKVNVTASGDIVVSSNANITITAAGTFKVSAATIELN
ncbi:phage baseplate assembly protein V [Pseudomonas sp. PDM14]|uniref:phage baseplate assembly protein V n=1 Tax=Pseudomonas sp. PDM14 TaxID=2769288 RepID=UPI00177ABE37|nr:phage baseplate assembly protein V [Pseudomonas sp. PDM14]MBD9483907.1 phage baseplate assembly protein V [Pseudomonas sp. PDM14]